MALKYGRSEKRMKVSARCFPEKLPTDFSWYLARLTVFQTVGCTKNVVQSRFLGL